MPDKPDNRELLVDYLLGNLPEDETERLDALSIADDEFALRLRSAEGDLIDAHVRGELSADAKTQFEARYLSSPEGRQRVYFAESLLAREQSRSTQTAAGRPMAITRWKLASAAAILLALASSLLLLTGRLPQDRESQTQVRGGDPAPGNRSGPAPGELPVPSRGIPPATSEAPDATRPPSTAEETRVFAFTVPAIVTRGADQPTITIPPGTTEVVLNLEGDAAPSRGVVVEVRTVDGRAVWTGPGKSAGRGLLTSVTVPAGSLEPDDYLVSVSSAPPGSAELWRFSFRVGTRSK